MKEYQNDADGTDVAYGKEVDAIVVVVVLVVVGKLIMHYLFGNVPAHKQTGQHASHGQHEVGRQLVAEVHERQTHHLYMNSRQSTPASMVTTHAAYLRGIRNSSLKKAVPISCIEMVEVSAAKTSRA